MATDERMAWCFKCQVQTGQREDPTDVRQGKYHCQVCGVHTGGYSLGTTINMATGAIIPGMEVRASWTVEESSEERL